MQERIVLILENYLDYKPHVITGIEQSAKEIFLLMKDFIEWKEEHTHIRNKNGRYIYWEHHYTLSTLFTYWYNNVYKK